MNRAAITRFAAFAVCKKKHVNKLFQRKIVITWLIRARQTLLHGSIHGGYPFESALLL